MEKKMMMRTLALFFLAGQSLALLTACCGTASHTPSDRDLLWARYDSLLRFDPDEADSLIEKEYRNYPLPPSDSIDYNQLLQRCASVATHRGDWEESDSLSDLVRDYCARHAGDCDYRLPGLGYRADVATAINALFSGRLQRATDYFEAARTTAYRYRMTERYYDVAINISDVYLDAGRLPEAAEVLRRGLFLCDSLEMSLSMKLPFYNSLSNLYLQLGDYSTAMRYSDDGVSCLEGASALDRFSFWSNRGNVYYLREDYEEALECFDSCADICREEDEISDYNAYITELNHCDVQVCLGRFEGIDARLDSCAAYFEANGIGPCNYYLATLRARILLKRDGDARGALALLEASPYTAPSDYLGYLRHRLLRECYTAIGASDSVVAVDDEMLAYKDSLLNNVAAMRVADVELRYKENVRAVKLLAHQRTLELRIAVIVTCLLVLVLTIVAATFRILYLRRQRRLTYEQLSNSVLKERVLNLRMRLSPHYLMNLAHLLDEAHCRQGDAPRAADEVDESAVALTLRQSMELSNQLAAPLDEELSFLKDYQQLLPQSKVVEVRYHVDEAVDTRRVRIPGMSLQLPVENAVKHAYPPSQPWPERCIDVTICRTERARHAGVEIRVEDFGVGLPEKTSQRFANGYHILTQTIAFLNSGNRVPLEMSLVDKARQSGGDAHGALFTLFVPDGFVFAE
jgi:tetratricopeptide (TPR) repeat protein